MNILDTDILTIVHRSKGKDFAAIEARLSMETPDSIYVTIVSFEEHMRGWLALLRRKRKIADQVTVYARLREVSDDYCHRNVLDFDEKASIRFTDLRKSRIRIGTMDLKIAAIALTLDATLITRNTSDFKKVPGLKIDDWTK